MTKQETSKQAFHKLSGGVDTPRTRCWRKRFKIGHICYGDLRPGPTHLVTDRTSHGPFGPQKPPRMPPLRRIPPRFGPHLVSPCPKPKLRNSEGTSPLCGSLLMVSNPQKLPQITPRYPRCGPRLPVWPLRSWASFVPFTSPNSRSKTSENAFLSTKCLWAS